MSSKENHMPSAWTRYGRGRRFSWHATDEEVVEYVENNLPDEFSPYSLLYRTWIKTGGRRGYWEEHEDIVTLFRSIASQGSFLFLLRSYALTPIYSSTQKDGSDINSPPPSLIVLNHYYGTSHKSHNGTSIGLVDKLVYEPTQAVYTNYSYLPLFNSIKRWWQKKLTCEVAYPYGNGRLQKFRATPAFVEQLRSGNYETDLIVLQEE